jgi:sulfur carrier protein
MKINLNNRPEKIAGKESLTVAELLEHKNYTFKFLVVRINDNAVKPGEYDDAMVRDGDNVKVIHLISGG